MVRIQLALILTYKTSQPYVVKKIGKEGLKSLISSAPLRAADLTTGIKELYKNDQPDVPIALFEDANAVSGAMNKTFVGLALNNETKPEEQPLNEDVIFHNELLFATVLILRPEIIKSPEYQKEIDNKINLLAPDERNNPEKIKQIKAEYLKGALAGKLSELGYPPNIFSSKAGQFLSLDGAVIANILLDIKARPEVGRAA